MNETEHLLTALLPIILLLSFGVVAAIGSRALSLSPIVGYILLGLLLRMAGFTLGPSMQTVSVLAQLGVVFLLFDIGLHFSLKRLRAQAGDIFGFGPAQVVLATAILALACHLAGLGWGGAFLLGAALSLSSTAVVVGLIAERHQQDCPVGLTATAILVFQDVAGIFILIVATALESGGGAFAASALALAKASLSFALSMVVARYLIRPALDLVARSRNEEVFTGVALLIALAAGWMTGMIGLSVTLGAFLGGTMLADTPYRSIIQSEIKPFRGLLLGFFFVSVGLSLDLRAMTESWYLVLLVALALLVLKTAANVTASLLFKWSVPGSLQLGFLLAQGSEFAFVILGLPGVRAAVGAERSSIVVAAVALTLAVTPNVAWAGRRLAGVLRARRMLRADPELQPQSLIGPVMILGMGEVGRAVADALIHFDIGYVAMETDQRRLREALADGYRVEFGDLSDPRIWQPTALEGRRVSVLTEPSLEVSGRLTPLTQRYFPQLLRVAVVRDAAAAVGFANAGLTPVIEGSDTNGLETAAFVLKALGTDDEKVGAWIVHRRAQAENGAEQPMKLAAR
ncbi:Kef-type potassium/proton antiporter, CPA2 family [Sphingomonas sp. NFR04]|uniref:cation:proton antiporter domain-containing protein n=1 Tax=Sphingomonas sp. NFR04 TaxID=1566283 RepID=UPI0008E0A3C1|nr:cation:proton antiporter [Sphingomonas sp. NFR04]SFJ70393.1 Kef-type potassium/proton antiporter, CPA2 family [Sphingomonas sp. NFR04]